ncbi:MAG: DNA-binding LytR/AlgR family response regulator [Algoriphagus sp.]|jgi:DNA-binding LytR/AlgR family response regulator
MTCIIIEDQAPAQRILQKFIKNYGNLTLKGTFSDPLEALAYLHGEQVGLLFLDIHLPKISGLDFLRTLKNKPYTILTTAYSEYAIEGFDLNVLDYLLKPFSFERFVQAVSRVPQNNQNTLSSTSRKELPPSIFIKSGYEYIKIDVKSIIYIKSDMDYTFLYLTDTKHLSSETLKYWQDSLNPDFFLRIHKSYIINLTQVEKIIGNQIYLSNQEVLPIGRAYKDILLKYLP